MSNWNYEDDLHSQRIVHWSCRALYRVNNILIALHKKITPSLHEEGFLDILAAKDDTEEILADIQRTFFRYRKLKKWSSALPKESELRVSPEQSTLINGE